MRDRVFEVVVVVWWLGVDTRREGEKDVERPNQERLVCILYVSLLHVLLCVLTEGTGSLHTNTQP